MEKKYIQTVYEELIRRGLSEKETLNLLRKYFPILLLAYKKDDHESFVSILTKIHSKRWKPERLFSYIGFKINVPQDKIIRYSKYLDGLNKENFEPIKIQCKNCHVILNMLEQPKEAIFCNCGSVGIENDFGNIALFSPYGNPKEFIEFDEDQFL